MQLLCQGKLKTRLLTQPSYTKSHAYEHHEHLEDKADHAKMTHDQNAHTLLPLFGGHALSILDTSREIWIPGTVMHQVQHRSYLVCTTAGAVCCQTWKHLRDRVVMKPDPEPTSVTDTPNVSLTMKPVCMHGRIHTCYMHQLLQLPSW